MGRYGDCHGDCHHNGHGDSHGDLHGDGGGVDEVKGAYEDSDDDIGKGRREAGRKVGRKEDKQAVRKEGRQEGRKEGRQAGRKEAKKEGRKEGRQTDMLGGRQEGRKQGILRTLFVESIIGSWVTMALIAPTSNPCQPSLSQNLANLSYRSSVSADITQSNPTIDLTDLRPPRKSSGLYWPFLTRIRLK